MLSRLCLLIRLCLPRPTLLAIAVLSIVLWLPASSAAQDPIPGVPTVVQFRVTRTAPNQPPSTYLWPMSATTCGVLPASVPATGPLVTFADPGVFNRSCYLAGAGNWSNLPAGLVWSFTIAAQGQDGSWSDESAPYVIGKPGAPTGFGIRPTFTGVALLGRIDQRFPFAGLDVVRFVLDDTGDAMHVGAATLTIPGFSPRLGDRVQIGIWR